VIFVEDAVSAVAPLDPDMIQIADGVRQRSCRSTAPNPPWEARLIDEAGMAAGTALADAGLTVTLPAGASRELVADVNRRLVGAGISVYGLREIQTSLEDWFLSVTSRLGETS